MGKIKLVVVVINSNQTVNKLTTDDIIVEP